MRTTNPSLLFVAAAFFHIISAEFTLASEMPGCQNKDVLPWELTSKDCETYLPNIHYSDSALNQQIADLKVNGRRQIDRLIYPVLAAPNLFFKGISQQFQANTNDELVVLLNLEDSKYSNILANANSVNIQENSKLLLKNDSKNGIFIYLTARENDKNGQRIYTLKDRSSASGKSVNGEVYSIKASEIWRYARSADMPLELKERAKIKFIFNQEDMKNVPAGFYDIRMEVVKNGKLDVSEFQYNAVRVFAKPESYQTNYDIINVTDSQISLGNEKVLGDFSFKQETHDRVIEFVTYLNNVVNKSKDLTPSDLKVQNSAFITFNGDVHNGGSPLNLKPEEVAQTYQKEAEAILNILKDLPLPIFLTVGNHDGYAATGVAPNIPRVSSQSEIFDFAQKMLNQGVIDEAIYKKYSQYLTALIKDDMPGGKEVDVHTGSVFNIKGQIKNVLKDDAILLETRKHFVEMNERILRLYADQFKDNEELTRRVSEYVGNPSENKKSVYLTTLEEMVGAIEGQVSTGEIKIDPKLMSKVRGEKREIIRDAQEKRREQLAKIRYKLTPVTYANNWKRVRDDQRNYMLYDGINQWRTTYGPTYQSWGMGDNLYLNMNSYDLRQHMRTGYGMYTVNYGGGVSQAQMDWIKKSVRSTINGKTREIVLLTHHDFRGGHKNVGHGFYVRQVPYKGMVEVAINFAKDEMIMPKLCEKAPKTLINSNTSTKLSCLQDGLQEWMRAEFKFDCDDDMKFHAEGDPNFSGAESDHVVIETKDGYEDLGTLKADNPLVGTCDYLSMRLSRERRPNYSGYQLIHLLSKSKNIKTYIIGHTHYNTLEVLAPGDELLRDTILLDESSHVSRNSFTSFFEGINPIRFKAWFKDKTGLFPKGNIEDVLSKLDHSTSGIKKAHLAVKDPIQKENAKALNLLVLDLDNSGHTFSRHLEHPLVILRFTSIAKLTEQLPASNDKKAFGFTLLSVDTTVDSTPLINEVTLLRSTDDNMSEFVTVDGGDQLRINRSRPSTSLDPDNSFNKLFDSSAARPMKDTLGGYFDDEVEDDQRATKGNGKPKPVKGELINSSSDF